MGYVQHNAIIVTGSGKEFNLAYEKAQNLFGELVTNVIPSINNFKSFFVATSGSKYGWEAQKQHDEKRVELADFIDSLQFGDGSNMVQFVDVAYDEDNDVFVERSNEGATIQR